VAGGRVGGGGEVGVTELLPFPVFTGGKRAKWNRRVKRLQSDSSRPLYDSMYIILLMYKNTSDRNLPKSSLSLTFFWSHKTTKGRNDYLCYVILHCVRL